MAQDHFLIAPKEGEQEIYLKQVGKNDSPQFVFPISEKQDNVAVGVLGTPHRSPLDRSNAWDYLELSSWILFLLLVFSAGAAVLWKILKGKIDIRYLLSESDGKASLSRFQAFIFTFVFVIGVMLIMVRTGQFPTDIPLSVLAILGGSLTTYLVSKGIGEARATNEPATSGVVRSRGPILRPGASPLSGSQVLETKSLSSGSALFTLPTMTGLPQQYTVIAVAVGENALILRPRGPEGIVVNGKVQYVDINGNLQTENFSGENKVKTPPNKITEVGVAFIADKAGIPVELEVVPA